MLREAALARVPMVVFVARTGKAAMRFTIVAGCAKWGILGPRDRAN
jgi:hypothetical protein